MSLPIAWSECYAHPLPEGHRFPMEKYELIPAQLLHEGTISKEQLFSAPPLEEVAILKTHDAKYWQRLSKLQLSAKEQRVSGFPHNAALIERERIIAAGTLTGAQRAWQGAQCALNVAGGTHHAYRDRAEGFCLLNDIALATHHLLSNFQLARVLIVDLDVHQGNGTAAIFQHDDRVFTFSMHGAKNYPLQKEKSDLDVPLADGVNDAQYLDLLRVNLNKAIECHRPQFIFYQAGVDILSSDRLGKLGVSLNGCKERDRMVFERCAQLGLPLQVSMGGGYSKDVRTIVEAHCNTFRLAMHYFG
jgi:acetoin utilization deacetylase AcuC-like enzyme